MQDNGSTVELPVSELETGYVLAEPVIIQGIRQLSAGDKLTMNSIRKLEQWDIEEVTVRKQEDRAA